MLALYGVTYWGLIPSTSRNDSRALSTTGCGPPTKNTKRERERARERSRRKGGRQLLSLKGLEYNVKKVMVSSEGAKKIQRRVAHVQETQCFNLPGQVREASKRRCCVSQVRLER